MSVFKKHQPQESRPYLRGTALDRLLSLEDEDAQSREDKNACLDWRLFVGATLAGALVPLRPKTTGMGTALCAVF